jgi:hypothetical protein
MAVCCASNLKKECAKRPLLFAGGLPHQTRSLSRIVCRGQEEPKGSKDTLRPILDLYIVFKKPVTKRNRKKVVRKSRYN